MNLLRSIGIFSVIALIGPMLRLVRLSLGSEWPLWFQIYIRDLEFTLWPMWFVVSAERGLVYDLAPIGANIIFFAIIGMVLYLIRKTKFFWVFLVTTMPLLAYATYLRGYGDLFFTVQIPALLTGLCIYVGGAMLVRRIP
jgi:hypothetical protein